MDLTALRDTTVASCLRQAGALRLSLPPIGVAFFGTLTLMAAKAARDQL